MSKYPLLEVLGSELESQTRRRLATEKTSPVRLPLQRTGFLQPVSGGLIDSMVYVGAWERRATRAHVGVHAAGGGR